MVVALVGNPNVGKSTVFNALTGLNQHTGNWPGKTVALAQGRYTYKGRGYVLVDLPGTYSLLSQSEEEQVAADHIRSGQSACTVVLVDATCLERNLVLALQVMELTDNVIVCVNLLDEARHKGLEIDLRALSRELGVPVVGTSANRGEGLEALQEAIRNLADGFLPLHPRRADVDRDHAGDPWDCSRSDQVSQQFAQRAAAVAEAAVLGRKAPEVQKFDRVALGRRSGYGILLLLLLAVFWVTMVGANLVSGRLQAAADALQNLLLAWTAAWPRQLAGLLVEGIYATCARVVAVMLPPMAIFFPLFTLLEDLGYLPRAAFLTDRCFQRCGSCGKQALTMAMGLGCNAVGVTGCRIIASPRERLLAVVTNALTPCNGRLAALVSIIFLFFTENSFLAAGFVTLLVLLSVLATFWSGRILSRTVLRSEESRFILELPPYRRPQVGKILVRAFLDRTVLVLGRAALVAAPAGGIIWVLQQVQAGGRPLLQVLAQWLEPAGAFLGMNGVILLAFLLAFPANELLLPSVVMLLGAGETGLSAAFLAAHGWDRQTALCTMLFVLFHWPCAATCLTIRKETGSWRWTLAAIALPTAIGVFLCALVGHL